VDVARCRRCGHALQGNNLALSADPPLRMRTFECSAGAVFSKRLCRGDRVQENRPFAIVNVSCDGDFSTYSPELLGLSSPRHGCFALGNIATYSLASVLAMPRFFTPDGEIVRGIEMCRQGCRYFGFCGGGPPGNKFFDHGIFASTQTRFCRLPKQACLDVSLDILERNKAPHDPFPCGRGRPELPPARRAGRPLAPCRRPGLAFAVRGRTVRDRAAECESGSAA
jgi:hypothetical protein